MGNIRSVVHPKLRTFNVSFYFVRGTGPLRVKDHDFYVSVDLGVSLALRLFPVGWRDPRVSRRVRLPWRVPYIKLNLLTLRKWRRSPPEDFELIRMFSGPLEPLYTYGIQSSLETLRRRDCSRVHYSGTGHVVWDSLRGTLHFHPWSRFRSIILQTFGTIV